MTGPRADWPAAEAPTEQQIAEILATDAEKRPAHPEVDEALAHECDTEVSYSSQNGSS